eukprot:3322482-Rhodomonas_salina.1
MAVNFTDVLGPLGGWKGTSTCLRARYAMPGTDLAYCASYAMCGTDAAYDATGTRLRALDAMRGTDLAYGATQTCNSTCLKPGTEVAYSAMRCGVLRWRMVLPVGAVDSGDGPIAAPLFA